jgi:hypothetical protein
MRNASAESHAQLPLAGPPAAEYFLHRSRCEIKFTWRTVFKANTLTSALAARRATYIRAPPIPRDGREERTVHSRPPGKRRRHGTFVSHCGGGDKPDRFDPLTAIATWVADQAPDSLSTSKISGWVDNR